MKWWIAGLLLPLGVGAADEVSLKLNLSSPRAGASAGPLTSISFTILKSDSGLDTASLSVHANFEVNGRPAGSELGPMFIETDPDVWTLPLSAALTSVSDGRIVIRVKDRGGNASIIDRQFSIAPGYLPPAIRIAPETAVLRPAGARQFSATGGPVKWSIAPHLGTISSSGLYVAPASLGEPATITVTATSATDPSQFGTAILKLEPAL